MNELQRNDPCWCGSGKKYKKCHYAFDERLKLYESPVSYTHLDVYKRQM